MIPCRVVRGARALQAEAARTERPGEAKEAAAAAGSADDSSGTDTDVGAGGGYSGSDDDEEWLEVARYEMLEEQLRGTAKVAVVEQCLAEGGRERVRVQLLLQSTGGRNEELDIQARPPSPAALWVAVLNVHHGIRHERHDRYDWCRCTAGAGSGGAPVARRLRSAWCSLDWQPSP